MNALDRDVFLHVADYMEMSDVAQLRATCEINRLLFSSFNVFGQALVNEYGANEGVEIAFEHFHEKVVLWICRNFTNQLRCESVYGFDWVKISADSNLSEDFIREFQDSVCWGNISGFQKLSETFIREFKDKVDWKEISFFQKLSETFIREFQNKVYWAYIPEGQVFSEAFREEFGNRLR